MSLTSKEYVNKVVNTLRYDAEEIYKQITPQKLDLLHMGIGISGEIMELEIADPTDVANVKEELGDLLFYVFGALEAAGQEYVYEEISEDEIFEKYASPEGIAAFVNIITACEKIVNEIKQHTILGKDLQDLTEHAIQVFDNVTLIAVNLGDSEFNFGKLLQSNHDKLFKRHHTGKFTTESALEKVDHKE